MQSNKQIFKICSHVNFFSGSCSHWPVTTTNFATKLSFYLALVYKLAFSFYVQFFKTSFFSRIFLLFQKISRYQYTLTHFQQKVFNNKLDKLFPNRPKFVFSLIHHSSSASLKTTCDTNMSSCVSYTFFTSVCQLNSQNLGLKFHLSSNDPYVLLNS